MKYIDASLPRKLTLSPVDQRHVDSKLSVESFDAHKPVIMSPSKRAGSRVRKVKTEHINIELFLMEW